MIIKTPDSNIKNINFYENGNLISYYKYFLDGNIEETKEIDKEKNQVIIQKYDKNKKTTNLLYINYKCHRLFDFLLNPLVKKQKEEWSELSAY